MLLFLNVHFKYLIFKKKFIGHVNSNWVSFQTFKNVIQSIIKFQIKVIQSLVQQIVKKVCHVSFKNDFVIDLLHRTEIFY